LVFLVSKVFQNFPKPLGLSLLLPQLSDQPNKKTCRANFQSSEKLTVITAPGKKKKTIPSSIIFTIFKGIFQVGKPPASFHFPTLFPENLVLMFNLLKAWKHFVC